jgi:hypothetical protein
MKFKGFWCVIICKSVFLDFVHRLYLNKITTFRKLDLLPFSGKKEGQKPLLLGPLVELASRSEASSFRNVVILLKYRRWTKSKKQLLQIITLIFRYMQKRPDNRNIFNCVESLVSLLRFIHCALESLYFHYAPK